MGTTYMVTGTISTSALVVVMFAFADGQSPPKTTTPSDADIRHILVDRIDLQHQSVGIVVGVIRPPARRVPPLRLSTTTTPPPSPAPPPPPPPPPPTPPPPPPPPTPPPPP